MEESEAVTRRTGGRRAGRAGRAGRVKGKWIGTIAVSGLNDRRVRGSALVLTWTNSDTVLRNVLPRGILGARTGRGTGSAEEPTNKRVTVLAQLLSLV